MSSALPPNATRGRILAQFLLGIGAWLFLALPYLRRTRGLDRLDPRQRYLFVCNHVSLLDTIMLGALCWRSRCYPILVLGDKSVWHASWIKRFLSSRIGFLLERGKLNPSRIEELQAFGRAGREFHLVVFPEGTRGDGVHVATCQPGVYHIAQEARLPLVPVFFANMHKVSTKRGRFHPLGGLRQVEVYFGEPIAPEAWLTLPRPEFTEFVRQSILAARVSECGVDAASSADRRQL
ncbi:MAG: 1-acyl-sn-glycerol-3-phosphate acyltransferase [Verrucomicrobiae bacterium]|nr:1-acyl-sn-glycerol-3-phosphate acyltransferase [Verrucomicrobiae bacterium]